MAKPVTPQVTSCTIRPVTIQAGITFYPSVVAAEAAALANAAEDPDWTYEVEANVNDGRAKVAIFDEDGEHLGYL